MLSQESFPGLFNTFSLTNHNNFAIVLVFAVLVGLSWVWLALSRSYAGLLSAGGFAVSRVRRLPQWPVALGLLAILSILIVIAPASAQTLKGSWAPVSLSTPQQANDLVSNLPRTSNETSASRQTDITTARDGFLRKTTVFSLWILIIISLAFVFNFPTACFKKAAVTLRDWFRYLYQLIDLPPPSSITVSA